MEIDFNVKSVSGLIGSLNIQIIPSDLNKKWKLSKFDSN